MPTDGVVLGKRLMPAFYLSFARLSAFTSPAAAQRTSRVSPAFRGHVLSVFHPFPISLALAQ